MDSMEKALLFYFTVPNLCFDEMVIDIIPSLGFEVFPGKGNQSNSVLCRIKDGAYYCYCAYVLGISRYSDFLSVILTSTGIF